MKRRSVSVLVIMMAGILLSRCCEYDISQTPDPSDCSFRGISNVEGQLRCRGLLGECRLVKMADAYYVVGELSGSWSLFWGRVSGNIRGGKGLLVYAQVGAEIALLEIPYEMTTFIIDDSKAVPTIEFIYDRQILEQEADGRSLDNLTIQEILRREYYIFDWSKSRDESYHPLLRGVRIRISQGDFTKYGE